MSKEWTFRALRSTNGSVTDVNEEQDGKQSTLLNRATNSVLFWCCNVKPTAWTTWKTLSLILAMLSLASAITGIVLAVQSSNSPATVITIDNGTVVITQADATISFPPSTPPVSPSAPPSPIMPGWHTIAHHSEATDWQQPWHYEPNVEGG